MDYRSIIESRYNRKDWLNLLHDIFKSGTQFPATPIVVNTNSHIAVQSLQLGTITLADDNKIAVYEILLSDSVDIKANRVSIRNLLLTDWKTKGCVGAFMFCYRDNESVLRFSYVSSIIKFNDDGGISREETDTKRYTYLLGEGHRSRTAIKQFEELKDSKLMLADLTKAFSIEALSERFFKDYKEIYEDIVEYATGKRIIKVSNKWEEKIVGTPNTNIMQEFSVFNDSEKAIRDYVKKLMGRIVFLQFIQKKGWLGVPAGKKWGEGDKEFLQHLYDSSIVNDNFIDGVLELLFDDINTKRENDLASPVIGKNIKIPYLNGGLFEKDRADKFGFKIPKELMDKMFSFFSAYNFTIDENDPDDAEIGVDPEMLGRIFENLLEDNKVKGAFYTPKEIVQYMCKESLIAYLQTGKNDVDKEYIRSFVTTYRIDNLNDELKSDIDRKLKDVKICDPAIGSGAFPMGLLKELFACRSAIEGLDNDNAADIKKHIIQNNIYGVDIEKGAVDIARLRFWLALIVDEKVPHALPNMDFKIMQGDSLISTFNGKYVNLNDNGLHLNSGKIRAAKKELIALQSNFYESEGETKKELLLKIKFLILEIVKLQMEYEYTDELENHVNELSLFAPPKIVGKKVDEEKGQIVYLCKELQISLSSQSQTISELSAIEIPFFDWKIMFSDIFKGEKQDGFDIVIGNPPYIQIQSNEGKLGELYKSAGFETFTKTGDIYCLFYEQGYNLLKENGYLCYITSNKWMRAEYGEKIRGFFANKTNPCLLVDFAGIKIFENATVDTNILLFENANNTLSTLCVKTTKDDKYCLSNLSDYVQQHQTICSFNSSENWVILSEIEQSIKRKIESVGIPLKDWDINIYRGVLTGCNEAFIITTEKRNEILNNCTTEDEKTKTAEIIRPILRGRDIKRYGYDWANIWLIWIPWHFPFHFDSSIQGASMVAENEFKILYPSIYSHLEKFKGQLEKRNKAETGIRYEWYALQRWGANYWDDFNKPKIVYPDIAQRLSFSLSTNKEFLSNTAYFFHSDNIMQLNYLLKILNSKLIDWHYRNLSVQLGEKAVRMFSIYVLKLPIPQVKYDEIIELVSEDEIDRYVYALYRLSDDEIAFIETL